jgi:hypothetical protein
MGLGADRGDVVRLILGRGMALIAGGTALGLVGAATAGHAIEGLSSASLPWTSS